MLAHLFACDYDGTIADGGRVAASTARALERVRRSGRKVVLVTGRRLDDLLGVCPEAGEMFDAIVAENGAVLRPAGAPARQLGDPPSPPLLQALRARGVPFDVGASLVATTAEHADAALAAIRETGVERTLVFNKGSLMLLPGGVTKQTGLEAALVGFSLSRHNVAGIGDAENDHAFLGMTECAVAVADAVPALRERADHVTRAAGGRGAVEFIEEHLLDDLRALVPGLHRHALVVGESAPGQLVSLGAHATNLLVVGPAESGTSTLTGLLVERLLDAQRTVCLLDPEGDYQTLAALPGVVVRGGQAGERVLPTAAELEQLLRQPGGGLVLDLSGMTREEKRAYAVTALMAVAGVRAVSGLPHWIVIDEAHHVFPADGSPAAELVRALGAPSCLITLGAPELPPGVLARMNGVASTEPRAFAEALAALASAGRGVPARLPAPAGAPLAAGQALLLAEETPALGPVRFTVSPRRVEHRRQVRKYAEGELTEEQSFSFRGARRQLNLRAANLTRFVELAAGVDDETWRYHLERHDYSTWLRTIVKDNELAAEVEAIEQSGARAARSREEIILAIRRRYSIGAVNPPVAQPPLAP